MDDAVQQEAAPSPPDATPAPILSLYSKMQANIELRKLLGIGIATREGDDDLSRMSDGELVGELKRLAAETGLDVTMTARAGRPCSE